MTRAEQVEGTRCRLNYCRQEIAAIGELLDGLEAQLPKRGERALPHEEAALAEIHARWQRLDAENGDLQQQERELLAELERLGADQ